jgi:hypothetical protein
MNSKRPILSAIGALGLLTLCGACAAYAAPPSDPCSLLTPAQVSAVLGVNVGAGNRLASKVCDWSASGQPAGTSAKKVTVTLLDAQGFAATKMPVNSKGITKTPVSGVGDDAVFGTTSGLATTLSVKKGDFFFVVRVSGFPLNPPSALDEVQAKEKTLALQILSKL